MDAVQHLRAQASQAGRLKSNAQVNVTTETQGGQAAIDIQPADPQVVYVPVYNPAYIWGLPAYGFYPPLFYPEFGFDSGSTGYLHRRLFRRPWMGRLGLGVELVRPLDLCEQPFFSSLWFYDFHGGGSFQGRGALAHDPGHRLGSLLHGALSTAREAGAARRGLRAIRN